MPFEGASVKTPSVNRRAPLVLGALGVVMLLAVFVIPALIRHAPSWPVFTQPKTECQADRRTVRLPRLA